MLAPRSEVGVWLRAASILMILAASWGVMAILGQPYVALVHAYYVPVLLAAWWFGAAAAIAVAVFAGLLGGPLAPPHLIPETHADLAWVARLLVYLLVGAIAARAVQELTARGNRMQEMYDTLSRLYSSTLQGFALALEMKDEETLAHCERVATNAKTLAVRLGLPAEACESVYWAGYLHDIGKLATPSHILAKPGELTPNEFETVKEHAVKGETLLLRVSPSFREVAKGIRHHHERWDGAGYPDGLAGEAIPLFGRVLAVVDVFEALTSDRPYRHAWGEEDAAAMIATEAGRHFDPAVSEVFLELWHADRLHVEGRHGQHPKARGGAVIAPSILAPRPDASRAP